MIAAVLVVVGAWSGTIITSVARPSASLAHYASFLVESVSVVIGSRSRVVIGLLSRTRFGAHHTANLAEPSIRRVLTWTRQVAITLFATVLSADGVSGCSVLDRLYAS